MAHINDCPHRPGYIHIHGDQPNRVVCICSKPEAKIAIKHGARMGLISRTDYLRLTVEADHRLNLRDAEPEQAPPGCQYNHTFIVSLFDVLDVTCGPGQLHPDDVH